MSEIEDVYPLTPVQSGILLHSVYQDAVTYVNQSVLSMNREPDVDVLRRAWRAVVLRHPVLRSAFMWADLKDPVQLVMGGVEPCIEVVHAEPGRGPMLEFLRDDRDRGFDLQQGPLVRLTVYVSETQPWCLIYTRHHLILDGWSDPLLLGELETTYDAMLRGRVARHPASPPFRDYIAWIASLDHSAAENYWRQTMEGFEGPGDFGSGEVDPSTGGQDGEVDSWLSSRATAEVLGFGRRMHLTMSTLAQGALALVYSQYTGRREVCFGVTSSGRPAQLTDVDSMVGMTLSTTPLRVSIRAGQDLGSMLHDLQRKQLVARQYEHVSISDIRSWSPGGSGSQLFDVLLVVQNQLAATPAEDAPLGLKEIEHTGRSNFPLTLDVFVSDGRLGFTAKYDRDRFNDEFVGQFVAHVQLTLEQMTAVPDVPVDTFVSTLFAIEGSAPTDPGDATTVSQALLRAASRHPRSAALAFGDRSYSYAGLAEWARAIAGLVAGRIATGSVVAVALERSPGMVAAALGVLRAGCSYLPVDPNLPTPLIADILADNDVSLVLTNQSAIDRFRDQVGEKAVALDEHEHEPVSGDAAVAVADTADPKGAGIRLNPGGASTRRAQVSLTDAAVGRAASSLARTMELTSRDRVLDVDSRLDLSVPSLFAPLMVGGCLVVRSEKYVDGVRGFRSACAEDQVSAVVAPAGFVIALVQPALSSREDRQHSAVRVVAVSGDELIPVADISRWRSDLPDVRLVRSFGPFECGRTALVCDAADSGTAVAAARVGRPAPGLALDVRDEAGRSRPPWFPGELFVAGCPVGGVRARRLPRERIEILGRTDDVVEIQGAPVSLEDVAARVLDHPAVVDCAVMAQPGPPRRLVAYLRVAAEGGSPAAQLREHLRLTLADHAVPHDFVVVDALPRPGARLTSVPTSVQGLSRTSREAAADEPRSSTELVLAQVWAEVLGVETVGHHENFFELGGDSLSMIRLIGSATQRGLRVSPRQIFENQTVASLAQVATAIEPLADDPADKDEDGSGVVTLLPSQSWFFEQNLVDRNLWNTEMLFRVRVDVGATRRALDAVMNHHDAFRLRFRPVDGEWTPWQDPCGPDEVAVLEQHDLSRGTPDERRAALLAVIRGAHRSLDITNGPTARFVQVRMSADEPDVLVAVIHHLVVDGVSSAILRQDLQTALQLTALGEQVVLPSKTASIQQWSRRLHEYAATRALEDLDHWRSLGAQPSILAAEYSAVPRGAVMARVVSLTRQETQTLMSVLPALAGVGVVDLLLAALVLCLRGWVDAPFLVGMESHGRDDLFPGVDISRTIGWFASGYPVSVGSCEQLDPGETCRLVSKQLRSVPDGGASFGPLCYFGPRAVRAEMAALPQPQVAFGYLGRDDTTKLPPTEGAMPAVLEGSSFAAIFGEQAPDEDDRYRSAPPDGAGTAVGVWVEDGRLTARFASAEGPDGLPQRHLLADRYLEALRELLAHEWTRP